jgi:hypothetical protein
VGTTDWSYVADTGAFLHVSGDAVVWEDCRRKWWCYRRDLNMKLGPYKAREPAMSGVNANYEHARRLSAPRKEIENV